MSSSQNGSDGQASGLRRLPLFLHHPGTRRRLVARPCGNWASFMNHYLYDGLGIQANLNTNGQDTNQCFSPQEFDDRQLWADPRLMSNVLSDALVLRPYSPHTFGRSAN